MAVVRSRYERCYEQVEECHSSILRRHAFDRVWHLGLLLKMLKIGMPDHLCCIFTNFLDNRTFHVRVESVISCSHPTTAGIPQDNFGALLYTIYTDIISVSTDATFALYANNIELVATSLNATHTAEKLQRALDQLPRQHKLIGVTRRHSEARTCREIGLSGRLLRRSVS